MNCTFVIHVSMNSSLTNRLKGKRRIDKVKSEKDEKGLDLLGRTCVPVSGLDNRSILLLQKVRQCDIPLRPFYCPPCNYFYVELCRKLVLQNRVCFQKHGNMYGNPGRVAHKIRRDKHRSCVHRIRESDLLCTKYNHEVLHK